MQDVSRDLLVWYDAGRRRLPWRDEVSPWRTLVSELMLQQTRVDTVLPYFERFMARFPTPEALAAAPMDELLSLWSGLGYYSRARNLHRAACMVAEQGAFPSDLAGLRALPGVGAYTAGAIASIALGQDAVAVDGNIERVISRLNRYEGPRDGIAPLAELILPSGRAGDFNQALMDLGATVCTPRAPRCAACPVSTSCAAYAVGDPERFPLKAARRPVPEVQGVCAILEEEGQVLLARRPERGLFGGLFELPGEDPVPEGLSPEAALSAALDARLGLKSSALRPLGTVKHVFTHRRLTLHVLRVRAEGSPSPRAFYTALARVDPRAPGGVGLSTLTLKALALLDEPQRKLF